MEFSATLLGTGGPKPDPDRMASTTLISFDGHHYLVDAGRGVTTRLVQAGIEPHELDGLFLTHFHFDHIGNLADLLLSIWNSGRNHPLPIFGPRGIRKIVDAMIAQVYTHDIAFRIREAQKTGDKLFPIDQLLQIIEIDEGWCWRDNNLNIKCQRVSHGHHDGENPAIEHDDWPCLGYRFEAAEKSIAISGDAVDCEGLAKLANQSDLLVLCCYLAKDEQTAFERDIISKYILVSSEQAGKIATKYSVKKLAVTHIRRKSDEMLAAMECDIRADFDGEIVMGRDLLRIGVWETGAFFT